MSFVLFITGPTASGKSSLAIDIAQKFDGEIVSCDSMQIYRGLDIGTAKPSKMEQSACVHHMIDVVDMDEDFTVQQYVTMATSIIDDILCRGKLPIVVGGTGLYIKSLIYEYSFASSPRSDEIRNYYKGVLSEKGKEYLHSLLENVDKESAENIHVNDTKRVIRALEIYDLTHSPKSSLKNEMSKRYGDSMLVVLNIDREVLYSNIDKRVDEMFDAGLLKEVEDIHKEHPNAKGYQSMHAIGYKEFFDYFDGKISLDDVRYLIKLNSRHYAKRQMTFFRKLDDVIILSPICDKDKLFDMIQNKISGE